MVVIVFVFFVIPETKGRSLEQLDEMFAKRVSVRDFGGFVTEHVPVDAERHPGAVIGEKSGGEDVVIENVGDRQA